MSWVGGKWTKFCTLGASQCSFTMHAKKVPAAHDTLYIAAGHNSAFSQHYIHKSCLSTSQLIDMLQEHHTKEEWELLFHSWKMNTQGILAEEFPRVDVLRSAIKPAKRFYSDLSDALDTPSKSDHLAATSLDSEFDLMDLPMNSLKELPQEEALERIFSQWDDLAANFSKFAAMMQQVKSLWP